MRSNYKIEVYLPPISLPFIREIMVTAWNHIIYEDETSRIEDITISKGLEVLLVSLTDSSLDIFKSKNININSIDQLSNELGKIDWIIRNKNILMQTKNKGKIFGLFNTWAKNINLYGMYRGFFNLKYRTYELKKSKNQSKPSVKTGKFSILVPTIYGLIWTEFGLKNALIDKNTYLTISDPIFDKAFANEFIGKDYKNIKTKLLNILNRLRGYKGDYPVMQDFISIRILLELLKNFYQSSIVYSYNWPTLRLYLGTGIEDNFNIIEISPALIDVTILAISTSSEYLGVKETKFINEIIRLMDELLKEGKVHINNFYAFINSILQGAPDIDLFYGIKRTRTALKISE